MLISDGGFAGDCAIYLAEATICDRTVVAQIRSAAECFTQFDFRASAPHGLMPNLLARCIASRSRPALGFSRTAVRESFQSPCVIVKSWRNRGHRLIGLDRRVFLILGRVWIGTTSPEHQISRRNALTLKYPVASWLWNGMSSAGF